MSQPVQGSYVVADPTGRNLLNCMEVGYVTAVEWDTDNDDGNPDGTPRPLLYVRFNGHGETIACTHVHAVLADYRKGE
jgi:hypothetical protein